MNSYLKKLAKEKKIKLDEPSDDIAKSYIQKSKKSLLSAKTLVKISHFDDAVALTYYSMYYSATALLAKCGIRCENHTGTIIFIKEIFGIENSDLLEAKDDRINKQYYVDFHASKHDVDESINTAEEFNSKLYHEIDKISENDIKEFRFKVKQYLK